MVGNKFPIRFFTALGAFTIGISITVFWIFSQEIYQLPPLNREKLDVVTQKDSPNVNGQSGNVKQMTEDFPKFKAHWNQNVLKPFEEIPLSTFSDSINENYRFFWIPSFHPAVSIRIWKTGSEKFLTAKVAGGEGFNVKKTVITTKKTLSDQEWTDFLDALERSKFWNKPLFESDDEPIMDGAFYLFEGKRNENYHEIHRTTPDEGLRSFGKFLINLAQIETEYTDY